MRYGTSIGGGLRIAVYPIRPSGPGPVRSCGFCGAPIRSEDEGSPTIIGLLTAEPGWEWECAACAELSEYEDLGLPPAIVVEDTVNYRGDYWERSLHPSEARFRRAMGGWVPEGYETELEEIHRAVATQALEKKLARTPEGEVDTPEREGKYNA